MNAHTELEICEDAFDMWIAETDPNVPDPLRIIMQKAWNAGWLGGLERGSGKVGSLVAKTAVGAIRDFGDKS